MSKHYLTVNYDGSIFEFSKDEKEGFVKHTNSTGKESYRKTFNKGVEGKLMWINKKTNQNLHNREEIEIVLGGENDTTYYLNFVVFGQDNFLDTYTEQLVRYLPKLEKGTVYNINNWFMKAGDTVNGNKVERNVKGITVKVAGEKIEPSLTYKTDENPNGDIPKLVWKEKGGKNIPTAASKEERSDYLYDVLQKECERLKYENTSSTSSSTQTETPKNSVPTATPEQAFEDASRTKSGRVSKNDELPF